VICTRSEGRVLRGVLTVAITLTLAACGGGGSIDPAEITADLPVVDGSTSTAPMRSLLVCGLLDTACEWSETVGGIHRVVVPSDSESPEADLIRDHVPTSGTHGSYESLITGDSDLIIVAREPSDEEKEAAKAAGVGLVIRPVARDAFVFLTNTANPVGSLTLAEVRSIYSGEITEWSVVGGPAGAIQPFQRDPTSGSQELMLRLVMRDAPIIEALDMLRLFSMMGPFNALVENTQGIGYSVYYYAAFMQPYDTVGMIAVDGVLPTAESIADGSYPLISDVFAVMRWGEGGSTRALMDWLGTEDGQAAIASTGYVPLLTWTRFWLSVSGR